MNESYKASRVRLRIVRENVFASVFIEFAAQRAHSNHTRMQFYRDCDLCCGGAKVLQNSKK